MRLIVAQLLVKTGLNKFFVIKKHGYKIKFSSSALAITLFANPNERDDDEHFLQKVLRPQDVYIDVGANIGTLALAAATLVGESGKVIAVEAHPGTFNSLQDNVRLNNFKNITTLNCAVGNRTGSAFFTNINSDDQNKILMKSEKGIKVPMDTLDNLLTNEKKINLLKIDVEGYEKFVLEGAGETLLKTDAVYFESWQEHFDEFDYSSAELLNMFYSLNFSLYQPMGNLLYTIMPDHISIGCQNLIAVKDIKAFCKRNNFKVVEPLFNSKD